MREKFELSCKIIGLVVFCFGVIYFLIALGFFLIRLDAMQLLPQSARALYSESQVAEVRATASYLGVYVIKLLIFWGVLFVLVGIYLMKSNNLFVKLCYPKKSKNISEFTPDEIQPETNIKQPQKEAETSSENKYAPPGYFK
jgi:predicted membrane protein